MARILVYLVVFLFLTSVQAEYMKYKDPKRPMNAGIYKDRMDRMAVQVKIGQMKNYSLGSLLSNGGSVPKAQADWIDEVNEFQNGSLSSRLGIPLIYGGDIDAVCGHNDNFYKFAVAVMLIALCELFLGELLADD